MKKKSEIEKDVLKYLSTKQGKWTGLWYGHFKGKDDTVDDVFYAMPNSTTEKDALEIMRGLYKKELVGGCDCGCRGDFEITDKGLKLIGEKRVKEYTGY